MREGDRDVDDGDGFGIAGPQRSFRPMNPAECVPEWSPFDRTVIHLQVNNGKGRGTPIYLPGTRESMGEKCRDATTTPKDSRLFSRRVPRLRGIDDARGDNSDLVRLLRRWISSLLFSAPKIYTWSENENSSMQIDFFFLISVSRNSKWNFARDVRDISFRFLFNLSIWIRVRNYNFNTCTTCISRTTKFTRKFTDLRWSIDGVLNSLKNDFSSS